jgi:hypothetical protein
MNSLPSKGYQSGFISDLKRIVENGIPSLAEIEKTAEDQFLTGEYIMSHFYNNRFGNETRDSFFSNEVEYILKGNLDDQINYNSVRNDLFLIRNVLNLIHIKKDPENGAKSKGLQRAYLGEGKEIGAFLVAEAWAPPNRKMFCVCLRPEKSYPDQRKGSLGRTDFIGLLIISGKRII